MAAKKPQRSNHLIWDGLLVAISLMGLYGFWLTETNVLLKSAVILLLVISLWQIVKKDTSSILFVTGFISTTVLFKLANNQVIRLEVAAVAVFVLILFLFNYHRMQDSKKVFLYQLFSVYNSLLGLLIAELFYILTFFPIESKNKAILVVLFLWLYDEFVDSFESGDLTRQFALQMSGLFTILFLALILTFPFQPGL